MVLPLRDVMAQLVTTYLHGFRLALLFDYDGTLTPLVEAPALARLEPAALRVLKRLVLRPRVSVGIISGRCLDDLRGLVDIPGLYSAGTSGLEFDLQGECLTVPAAAAYRGVVKEVVGLLRALTAGYPGACVESKELGLTLHYRHVARPLRGALLEHAARVIGPYLGRLRVVEGALAWEITPAVGWDKGSALRLILDAIGSPVIPLYAGDGANDGEAIAAATALGGIAVGIGPEAPESVHHRLDRPAALVSFLENLEDALEAGPVAAAVRPLSGRPTYMALKPA
jgi:trehalose-phosphatase